jgi:hypothetical protein
MKTPANKGLLQSLYAGADAQKPNKTGQKTGLDGRESRKNPELIRLFASRSSVAGSGLDLGGPWPFCRFRPIA